VGRLGPWAVKLTAHDRALSRDGKAREQFIPLVIEVGPPANVGWCVRCSAELDNWTPAAVYDASRISYSTGETMPTAECRRSGVWENCREDAD
jgi:hypothetical protein